MFAPLPLGPFGKDAHSAFRAGDLVILFRRDHETGAVGLELWPASMAGRGAEPREFLDEHAVAVLPAFIGKIRANAADSLVQVKLAGDAYPGSYSGGRTMRGGVSVSRLRLRSQEVRNGALLTVLEDDAKGMEYEHRIEPLAGGAALRITTTARNRGPEAVTIEALSSFSIGGLTPFARDDAPGRLRLHRFRSAWSAEGRLETLTFEQLQLERSWTGHGAACERFGQAGSMPVNGWFPFAAVEDTEAGVVWAAKIAWLGSWQMEVHRRHDRASLSGGLADREFGHWMRRLEPGGVFETPPALVTVVAGDLDDACDRLNAAQPLNIPPEEESLPVVFNDWCCTWGAPTHESMMAAAARLKGLGVRYLVMDDGWAERKGEMFLQNGDWRVNMKSFPGGLRATTKALREQGYVPGIWFEFEALTDGSDAWREHAAHVLHRDGLPLEVGNRRFWDFRDPWVHDYLGEKVIRLLRENGIGYLKVDYNDTIGIGCDGAESPGAGLYDHLQGVRRFFRRLREELPHLVIENCSSGGHRLEPSMLELTAMSSSSDAHETPEIPVIAANLLRLVPARQLQIWAVMRPEDTPERAVYSLAAALLGRICLSGPAGRLSDGQIATIKHALDLYHSASSLLTEGVNRRYGRWGESWRHLTGWQAVRRLSADGRRALVVAHVFRAAPAECPVPLPGEGWRIEASLEAAGDSARIEGSELTAAFTGGWRGGAWLLSR